MKKIKDKWGHLLDQDTCLHDLKDTILKAIPDLLSRIDTKEFEANSVTQLNAFYGRGGNSSGARGGRFSGNRGRYQGGNFRQPQNRNQYSRKFCRVCQAARCPRSVFTGHNVSECPRWTKKDVEDLRVMMCEMKTDPDEFPDSASDTDQEQE